MTLHVISQRKAVEIGWSTDKVKGSHVSLQAEGEEKRDTENDGKAVLFFPNDFTGAVSVNVKGSHSGEESGSISVS